MSREKATLKVNNRINGTTSKKKVSPVVIAVPAIALAAVIGVAAITFAGDNVTPNTVVTPDNVEEIIASIPEEDKIPIGSYETIMSTVWHFADGYSASTDAYVENSAANSSTVYFTIKLSDTDEEIFKSPYIPVGSSLADITLNYELEKGTYDAVLTYHLVDEGYKDLSRVSVGLTIIIGD